MDPTTSPEPTWAPPGKAILNFVLYQNQVWVNRRNLVAYLDREIEIIQTNRIGINDYWDNSKIEYLELIKKQLVGLDPNTANEGTV